MTTKDEALKLALEALERVNANPSLEDWHHAFDEEVVAIREALAEESSGTEQPAQQQEPFVTKNKSGITLHVGWDDLPVGTKLYTSPQASKPFVGLTDEEIQKIWRNSEHMTVNQVCRAIEAKLREKNNVF